MKVSLDTDHRRSPWSVSLAKRGLGDHAGQVVHKVVHEAVPGAAPRPALADGGGRDGGDEAGGRVAQAAVQPGEEGSHLHIVNIVNISMLVPQIDPSVKLYNHGEGPS